MAGKPIGALNGPWALLHKVTLVLVPALCSVLLAIAVPWVRWMTERGYATEAQADIILSMEKTLEDVQAQVHRMPTKEYQDRIKSLEMDMRTNLNDHTNIKVSLGRIEERLGTKKEPGS
jgi:hypothetical protein